MRLSEGFRGGAILKLPGPAAATFLASAQMVFAHGAFPGVTGFSFGATHTVTGPIEILAFFGCGILSARAPSGHVLYRLSLFAIAVLAGMIIGQFGLGPGLEYQTLLGIITAAMIVSAIMPWLPAPLTYAFLAAIGGFAGIVNAPGPAPASHVAATMAGSLFGAIVLTALVAFLASRLLKMQLSWNEIALRVVSAWLAAIAAIALALLVRSLM